MVKNNECYYLYKNKTTDKKIFKLKFLNNGDYCVDYLNNTVELAQQEAKNRIIDNIPVKDVELSQSNTDTEPGSDVENSVCTYGKFGTTTKEVFGYIATHIVHKNNNAIVKLIDWDNKPKNYLCNFDSKTSFLESLQLEKTDNGFAVIPFGQDNSEHWTTMLIDLRDKNIYMFDSTQQNFESTKIREEIFGEKLSKEVIPINDYGVQSDKAGTCGIWTMLMCAEMAKQSSINDILKIDEETHQLILNNELLKAVAQKGYDIVDRTRIEYRYGGLENEPANYSSYFYKEEILNEQLLKKQISIEQYQLQNNAFIQQIKSNGIAIADNNTTDIADIPRVAKQEQVNINIQ